MPATCDRSGPSRESAGFARGAAPAQGLLDGSVRDSVYYGIVDDEWPQVKARLEGLLARR
jgi:hypothetical protein